MRDSRNIKHHSRLLLNLIVYSIFIWTLDILSTDMVFIPTTAEDVTSPPFRLVPYHSILSAMFHPLPRRGRQDNIRSWFNNDHPARRHQRPPSRYQDRFRRLHNHRKIPGRRRYPSQYTKYSGRPHFPIRKPPNAFSPEGIIIDVQPYNVKEMCDIHLKFKLETGC